MSDYRNMKVNESDLLSALPQGRGDKNGDNQQANRYDQIENHNIIGHFFTSFIIDKLIAQQTKVRKPPEANIFKSILLPEKKGTTVVANKTCPVKTRMSESLSNCASVKNSCIEGHFNTQVNRVSTLAAGLSTRDREVNDKF